MSKAVPMYSEGQPGEDKGSNDSCLIDDLRENIEALYLNPHLSDVTFVVQGERIYGHRLLLAARCDYFRAMFCGRMKESSEGEIRLEGTNALAFRTILRYIYTSRVEVSAFEVEELLAILRLAHRYGLVKIQRPIIDRLKRNLDVNNVLTILRTSTLLFDDLTESCMQIVDQHNSEVLASRDFLTLPQKAVMDILSRDSLSVPEIDIFKAVCEWIRVQPYEGSTAEELFGDFIAKKCLRLDLMSPEELLSTVRHTELFEGNSSALDKFILDALTRQFQGTVSDLRGCVDGIEQPEEILRHLGQPYAINSVELEMADCGLDTTSEEGREEAEEYYEDDDYDDDYLEGDEDAFWYKVEKSRWKKKRWKEEDDDDIYWDKIEEKKEEKEKEKKKKRRRKKKNKRTN